MFDENSINLNIAYRQIAILTKDWPNNFPDALMEIRCIKSGKIKTIKFQPNNPSELEAALETAKLNNEDGFSIYCLVNPSSPSASGSISDEHILGSKFNFADADTEESFTSLQNAEIEPDFIVITGTEPHFRAHFYWELAEPVFELARWSSLQKDIAAFHGADTSIFNPSRIMRLAGFFTHPSPQKQSRGYQNEIVTLKENSK